MPKLRMATFLKRVQYLIYPGVNVCPSETELQMDNQIAKIGEICGSEGDELARGCAAS